RATTINGGAVGVIAQICADLSIPFLTFSTDYVFDGRAAIPYVESDAVGPVSAYGRSKLRGEELAMTKYPRSLVVRTSWVISATHDNFISTILRLAQKGPLKVVDDQHGKPTIAADLAATAARVLESGSHGILHLANHGETTWYRLATTATQLAGLDPSLVDPCKSDEFPSAAVRPPYSVLGTERAGEPQLPSWQSSLPSLVADQVQRIR
ncbi:MAG: NAD(P)-dependent oxidoreductase, partial [Actinomycetota bacterium]|nr:NAD(P)-dependent oxidoreductase [Actinomycetota bacterium]